MDKILYEDLFAALRHSDALKGRVRSETSYTPGSVARVARMAIHLDLTLPSDSSSLPEDAGEQPLMPSAWPCSR